MEITINYLAILVSAVIAMIIGALWYGPIFGKKWRKVSGKKKGAKGLYITQFLVTLFQVWVLASFIGGWDDFDNVKNILWIWAGFIIPTIAAGAMWDNDSKKVQWTRFLIQGGYQLIIFAVFGFILTNWK